MFEGKGSILVTGAAGFIGSNFVIQLVSQGGRKIVNLDKLTYAGNRSNLTLIEHDPNYSFVHGDICDVELLRNVLSAHRPSAIVHFAAESHVDRSIAGPKAFLNTNINGTFTLLEAAKEHHSQLPRKEQDEFRFLHVSTDEV